MSVTLYDEAIVNKIKKAMGEDVRVLSPDETMDLFKIKADMNNDKPIALPFISITRDRNIDLEYPHKKMMTFDGIMLDADNNTTLQIDAIPMKLGYSIEIYTRYKKDADAYMREIVFGLVNNPVVKIILPYHNINYPHWSNIQLLSTIEDNSDVPNRLASDQFTRWTISFTIDDAYLFSLPYVPNVHIGDTELETIEN